MSDVKTENIADGEFLDSPSLKEELQSTYTVAELEEATNRLHAPKECISAALKEKKRTAFTMEEAAQIIQNFLSREVKQ